MTRFILRIILVGFFLFAGASVASAAGFLDFAMGPPHPNCPGPVSPSISYAGGATPLVGVCISVDSVVGVGSPANSGVLRLISNGRLDFTTGNLTGLSATQWFFGGGGGITITGGIPLLGIADGTLLMSGTWNSATVVGVGPTFKITGGLFQDFKDATLAAFYGYAGGPGFPWQGDVNLGFSAVGFPPPSAFSCVHSEVVGSPSFNPCLGSGDVRNFPQVPEPASASLLGYALGLIGLAGVGRKRLLVAA